MESNDSIGDTLPPQRFESLRYSAGGRFVRRYWLTIAFLGGFVTDTLLLNRVDDFIDNLILFTYLLLAFVSMTGLYLGVAERVGERLSQGLREWMPMVLQYAFGGLLSGMFIFYGRSGDWLVSAPLLLGFVAVMVANEVVEDRVSRVVYNLSLLFIGLFAYVVLLVPVLLGKMGPLIFVGSGFLALALMYAYIQLLATIIPHFLRLQMRGIVFCIGSIFVAYNGLYFTNIIPPIPLSLQEIGIYHSVVRYDDSGEYRLRYEPSPWWQFWQKESSVFRASNGGAVYCFSNIFAPTQIATEVQHRWEYRDTSGVWQKHAVISYPIRAVGSKGYRGYTKISNYHAGEYRCSVETTRGQVLGRHNFWIDPTATPTEFTTRVD